MGRERWGLVSRLTTSDDVLGEALALAQELADRPLEALAMTKQLFWTSQDHRTAPLVGPYSTISPGQPARCAGATGRSSAVDGPVDASGAAIAAAAPNVGVGVHDQLLQFVQLKPGHTATAQELVDFCVGRIASYRVPRYIRFVTEWPMSGTKVKKVELRARIAAELQEEGITEAPRVTAR